MPMTRPRVVAPRKLIEVALPLDDINKASAREKSIRHGHPSTLHLWWARRPLAAARAVLFAQLVNDPAWKYSAEDLKKPQVKSAITRKRNELFKLITKLVLWENSTNEEVLSKARAEIRASWRETCEANRSHPDAATRFNPALPPHVHDPFAGGGAIPVEAQRLGLDVRATDLNQVAVLINKAMIELPSRFANIAPVGPAPSEQRQTKAGATETWAGARGLAEDVRRYGSWTRDQALSRLSDLYPTIKITKGIIKDRPDLAQYDGRSLTVIAWIWARTAKSPNPAANGRLSPLVSSFLLATKPGKEAWVETTVNQRGFKFDVRTGEPPAERAAGLRNGTRAGKAQDFVCVYTGTPITRDFIRDEGKAGRLGEALMAIVLEGDRGRVYLSPHHAPIPLPSAVQAATAREARSSFLSGATPTRAMITGGVCSAYGLTTWGSLFTDRQLTFLLTMTELISEAKERAARDYAAAHKVSPEAAEDYGRCVATYLAFTLSRSVDRGSSLCSWDSSPKMEALRNTFGRQALPMVWDFAEGNPFSSSSGSWENNVEWVALAVERLPAVASGTARQADAQSVDIANAVISCDPPYYDNISYAEISDFFYLWLRRALPWERKDLFATLLTPKMEELVVAPHRHGGKAAAEKFFLDGMTSAFRRMAETAHPAFPVTIYYAFKQSDTDGEDGTSSSGWETFLEACFQAGFYLSGTWPMRTELGNRLVGVERNALASSIVLVFHARSSESPTIARKDFLRELERVLPGALDEMTADPEAAVAPVDLAQAAIGPGMAVFSKYAAVLEADGSPMRVRSALVHINKAIDEYFAHAEGGLDADTRFAIGWFQQYGFDTGIFGEADVLARAKGTSVEGVRNAGVLEATKGKVRLLKINELPAAWDPAKDDRLPVWEACHHLCRALGESEGDAGALLARMPEKQEAVRLLAYRLYTVCERKGWAEQARAYNDLITSWSAIVEASQRVGVKGTQMELV